MKILKGLGLCALLCISESRGGFSLAPTLAYGGIENQTAYLKTEIQPWKALGLRSRYRLGFFQAGLQLELGRFDGSSAGSAALDGGVSLPIGHLPILDAPMRLDLRGGMAYNGYVFTHWYGHNSIAVTYNHFLSPMAGWDAEIGRWSLGGEYLVGSHLVWKARIGFRVLGTG